MSLGADLDDPNDYVFRARLLNPHTLLHVLQAIDLHDTAAVFINNCGIRFTVDKESGFQISSFLERSLFDLFDIVDDSRTITFRVGIRHLINSLNPLIDTFDRSSNASNDPDNPESNKSSIQMLYRGMIECIFL